tara:strand:+ start:840 stop:1286 length:447 start_codon:yes stop_codon:yes gene_type:complete
MFMPVFNREEAHDFWKDFDDPTVYSVICVMEASENWALDNDQSVILKLTELGYAMDKMEDVSEAFQKQLLPLLSQISISVKLYIMYSLDMIKMRSAEKLIILAESNPDLPGASRFLDRNLVFERLRLLSRLLSKDRLETVKEVISEGR